MKAAKLSDLLAFRVTLAVGRRQTMRCLMSVRYGSCRSGVDSKTPPGKVGDLLLISYFGRAEASRAASREVPISLGNR